MDGGETCHQAAIRETMEEAGVNVVLKGILRIDNSIKSNFIRQRIIYYAEPVDQKQIPKQFSDH